MQEKKTLAAIHASLRSLKKQRSPQCSSSILKSWISLIRTKLFSWEIFFCVTAARLPATSVILLQPRATGSRKSYKLFVIRNSEKEIEISFSRCSMCLPYRKTQCRNKRMTAIQHFRSDIFKIQFISGLNFLQLFFHFGSEHF